MYFNNLDMNTNTITESYTKLTYVSKLFKNWINE